ncbi:MAG: DUF5060 domain-containing protein [Bacteroidota bacterium]
MRNRQPNSDTITSSILSFGSVWIAACVCFMLLQSTTVAAQDGWAWETIDAVGEPTARHEAGFVAYKDKLYLIGGRRINPTDEFDPRSNTWTEKSPPPIELHHFQPIVVDDAIYLMGAMTGGWPMEKPLDRVIIYYPERDEYAYGHPIPAHRQRGGAGVAYHNGKIYLVGGITNGHMDGYRPWFDEYDPETGVWRTLPDAPNARDHFQVAVANNRLYAFAGRTSSRRTGEDMSLTVEYGNVYDFERGEWLPVTKNLALPTLRAGNAAFAWQNEIVIGGGESMTQEAAHLEVEAYNVEKGTWRTWPALERGRHGSGFAVIDDYVYKASGSGNRGGGPELTSIERLKLPNANPVTEADALDRIPVFQQWHTVTLPFSGAQTAEDAADNPFLNYRLSVDYIHEETQYTIRGFYAADGNAAETGADAGNVWQVRFTPDRVGSWRYVARLHQGDNIALSDNLTEGTAVDLPGAEGSFVVVPSDKDGVDFRNHGRLEAHEGFFRFRHSGEYWLKGGADSPENLLAYEDFDGTYRLSASADEGEASTTDQIHAYAPHLEDWKSGDPTWQGEKGKSLIGAVNYLASTGMNAVYFIVMNIEGDGKDVWPYRTPDDFTRFDVSKLAQWEVVFQHMQAKGILLHVVLQETENELMLDGGDTGPMRQLYLRELIARFGHHLALKWNIGEENGPASWTPNAQNDRQRRDMASFIKQADPYNHPVLLHTHSHDPERSNILSQILGFEDLDGLSLQVDKREGAATVVETWRENARNAGHEWLVSMDEIGMWHTGALPDSLDPDHDSLRQYVLWGTLLSGAAGVEWYFGANNLHNDLTSEDWRRRARLWELTDYALTFFNANLPYWEMQPMHNIVSATDAYCLGKRGEVYAIYLADAAEHTIDLRAAEGGFSLQWYNPLTGGELREGTVTTIQGGAMRSLGSPPPGSYPSNQDWVILVKKNQDS